MKEFIFTFGFGQPLKNCYVVITAEDSGAAREKMFEAYGPKWAMEYDSREAAGVDRFNLKEVPFGTPNIDQWEEAAKRTQAELTELKTKLKEL